MDSSEQRNELPQQQQPQPQPQPPQQQQPYKHNSPVPHPSLITQLPSPAAFPLRTAESTPMSSPGLFSPTAIRHSGILAHTSLSESNTPAPHGGIPYLHPLQNHKVRETHKALIDSDIATGRKLINQYEVIEEIGRGMHGKVKLARNLETGDNVAIKIIPRFSKKRRLGKVTAMSPQDKTKKEIAILKKIRHPNVVALLEVIDDPELKKIYMVLEHVELGEIVWRKKGLPHICLYERRRIEREMRGEPPSAEEEKYEQLLERRQAIKKLKRAKMAQNYAGPQDFWSVEHGAAEDASSAGQQSRISSKEDFAIMDTMSSRSFSRPSSRAPSRAQSVVSMAAASIDPDESVEWNDDMETPGPLRSNPASVTALDGIMWGSHIDEAASRGRSPSMADSIISHMSSVDYNLHSHDPFADDYSYVPCFTLDQARSTFRDTVLGLEYLHYQGVVHRDIKPANLLWSRDHRVKISDFGVSYFGRPIRDGEFGDETVSESEAKDFDDDLELAKTVGTPAFFAPELCYTDIDREQPKVSEQIDVWSLGVTLYCLIFARIPFLAEDEFQMFRKIATDDVYIPRRRLKPVDPSTSPAGTSLYKRQNIFPYRDDNDLEYEDVDNLLYDLLRQMLTKNPDKRIRLRDIKRHPWVVQDIPNPIGWLDDTDPARPSSGRKIQVDERDVSAAVVPITFLDHVRSAVKKAVGKVIHPLVERSDSKSRRRAASSATSSAGDLSNPQLRNERRRSIRPDDYFATGVKEAYPNKESEPAKDSSLEIETEPVAYDPMATVLPPIDLPRGLSASSMNADNRRDEPTNPSHKFTLRPRHSHGHGSGHGLRRLSQHFQHLGAPLSMPVAQTTPCTPLYDGAQDILGREAEAMRQSRRSDLATDEISRARSVDRGLFASNDKRAQPQVAVSTAVAPGSVHRPTHPRPMRSVDLGSSAQYPVPQLSSSPLSAPALELHGHSLSDHKLQTRYRPSPYERPQTVCQPERAREVRSNAARTRSASKPESPAGILGVPTRSHQRGIEEAIERMQLVAPANVPCPPSPEDDEWDQQVSRQSTGDAMITAQSSSTESMEGLGTPLTSPSEVTSPISAYPPGKITSERILAFQSDPSLPALLSNASSISADMEAELLCQPGIVGTQASLLETTDSLTPPAMLKEPTNGFPIGQVFENPPAMDSGSLAMPLHSDRSFTPAGRAPENRPSRNDSDEDEDEDGSDDGIFLMAKPKRKSAVVHSGPPRGPPFEAKRRDTDMSNISTASNETAKRVVVDETTT
ncbi:Serine/threonine-protein kinase ssp1 [Paramyrothecium foliicola]|nr:Serine/threonine-protein kinase ssp1 [Paramyrothecium foliicola]